MIFKGTEQSVTKTRVERPTRNEFNVAIIALRTAVVRDNRSDVTKQALNQVAAWLQDQRENPV